jgi:hypothetical protein
VATRGRGGQSLIESCIVLAAICLLFFGLFQVSQIFAAREVLDYAAGRALRSKTVGFNRFMVMKSLRVGSIPNAGQMTVPPSAGGPAVQYAIERARIPLYLEAANGARLSAILGYEDWSTIRPSEPEALADGTLHIEVSQDYPLRLPMHRSFYAADSMPLTGESRIDSHYLLYMYDAGW